LIGKQIALKKRKGALKHTWSIQKGHQNKRKKEKKKKKKEQPKNPKDRRKVTSNPQLLASNPTGTHTPSIEINRVF
jgi:hypothetical protein